jgi:hypothetical protein
MKKSLLINIIVFICSLFLITSITSCKKKDKTGDIGPAGSQGNQGTTGLFTTISDGYLQGTISGINKSGVSFVETYTYSLYTGDIKESYIDSVNSSTYEVDIVRYATTNLGEKADFRFTASSLLPLTVSSSSFNFNFIKSLGDNKYFIFTSNYGVSPTLSGLNYDKSTGIITGNYLLNLTGSQNSTGNPANITGSFKATLKPYWY